MAKRTSNLRFGTLFLAVGIALVLWGMAHGSSEIERGFDVPVVFQGISNELVLTDQSADVVNIRVLGTRAALRNITLSKLEYPIEVAGSKPGLAVYEIDATRIEVPPGVAIISRSPAILEAKYERAGRRSVKVRPDIEGDPPEGFKLVSVGVDPARVWIAGARSDVLRLSEVVTETIDVGGLEATTERDVRLTLGGGHVWMEESAPVTVRIEIEPIPAEPAEDEVTEG